MWWFLIIMTVAATIIFIRLKQKNKYWIRKGVKQGSPVPLFGDKWRAIAHNQSLADMVQKIYNVGEDDRYCGAYDFMSPALVLKDPDLIKNILVKDFDHFVDHKRVIPEGSDPIWDRNLFFLTGQKWRDMRSALSPVFTGSKMRHMFVLITKSAEQFVEHFVKQNKQVHAIELKDTFARLTNDIIATTVFGFQSDSLEDRDSKFYEMAKRITDFTGFWQGIKLLGFFIFPKLYKTLNIKILSEQISNFFYRIVKENIKTRTEQNINRPDMISLLMEARENHKLIHGVKITDEDITAQALVFFFAGFDSVSSLMCFMSYELATNPDIQERLIQEIDKTSELCDRKLDYEAVKSMKYLDMVVSEALRKWPITPFVNRICTIPYTIEPKRPNEQPIHLEKDAIVFLPIYGLHHDPKHFPNPDRFDPERFSEENKPNITPYTYVPFGAGPRKCIGYRFALLEIKVLFFYLLSKFEIVVTERTEIPVKICKKSLNMTPDGGLWVALKRRN
ncbi:cytochrome P450 9e2-like isoform X1 [Zophobas morio]|uniref:cytochrome P450 9e2-like isoform X1 n=2 Tax=Zophobas morio TaxID=2755281 RepID=UPI003082D062